MFIRAIQDTRSHLKELAFTAVTGFAGLVVLYYWQGTNMALSEAPFYVVGLTGALIGVAILFLWNLAAAPYRIQRERADEAEQKLADLQSSTPLPNAVLRSLSDHQSASETNERRMIFLAHLFEQYKRLLKSTFLWAEHLETPIEDIGIVAKFISDEVDKILPKQPFAPEQPLIFQTGWNQYRYIFNSAMRIPPTVTFPEAQDGIEAAILHVSKIDFEVRFWHIASQNCEIVPPQPFEASAEL